MMDPEQYYNMMRMTNEEQHEFLREIIHHLTTLGFKPLWVFFTGPAGCSKMFVIWLAMDVYNRYCNGGSSDPAYNAYVVCASTGKAAVAVGEGPSTRPSISLVTTTEV